MMRIFHTTFKQKNLTENAGLALIGRFAQKLDLRKMLDTHITIQRGETAKYQIADAVVMVILGVLAGAKNISHLEMLRADNPFRKLLKWNQFPDNTTFARIFRLFNFKHCKELSEVEHRLREKVWAKAHIDQVTLELDSTLREVSGFQEGTTSGHDPQNKDQRAYRPLLCFISETRECLHNRFRSGEPCSTEEMVEFLKESLPRLPEQVQVVTIKGDSTFFDEKLLDTLEEQGVQYMIKARTKALEGPLLAQKWRKIKSVKEFESTAFECQCRKWKKPRRFIAVRETVFAESDDAPLPRIENQHKYTCFVTNMDITPWAGHKFFEKPGAGGRWIEWCKNNMASGSILTQEFWANSALFQSALLAYNLLVWMLWLNHENGFRENPDIVRMQLIRVPAKLVHRSRQWFLDFDEAYPYKELYQEVDAAIQNLEFK